MFEILHSDWNLKLIFAQKQAVEPPNPRQFQLCI